MTSIIQSNRERKSRLDAGLVERLNARPDGQNSETKRTEPYVNQPKITPPAAFGFLDDEKMYADIVKYVDMNFPVQKQLFKQNTTFGNIMASHYYGALMTDMYLKHINSEFRIATLAEIEQNKGALEGPVHVGIILNNRESASIIQRFYKELDDLAPKTSPLWVDLRGLRIDDDSYLHVTHDTRFKMHADLGKDFRYSETDDFGLPKCQDINGDRRFRYTEIIGPFAYTAAGLMEYNGICEIILSTRK